MEKPINISAAKLNRYYDFLKEVNELAIKKGYLKFKEIDLLRKKHATSSNAFAAGISAGLFAKVKFGTYKTLYVHSIEPRHARQVIEAEHKMYPTLNLYKPKPKAKKVTVSKEQKPVITKEPVVKTKYKTISLFWGLYKKVVPVTA